MKTLAVNTLNFYWHLCSKRYFNSRPIGFMSPLSWWRRWRFCSFKDATGNSQSGSFRSRPNSRKAVLLVRREQQRGERRSKRINNVQKYVYFNTSFNHNAVEMIDRQCCMLNLISLKYVKESKTLLWSRSLFIVPENNCFYR